MDRGAWQEYLKLLGNVGRTMEQLTEIERKKTDAVGRSDLNAVEECMKQEQVLSLSLRGYDQKRDAMLAKLGIPGTSLTQLERHSPEGLEMETKRAAEALRGQYERFQAASKVARSALECNLRVIERLRKEQEAQQGPEIPREQGAGYDFRG